MSTQYKFQSNLLIVFVVCLSAYAVFIGGPIAARGIMHGFNNANAESILSDVHASNVKFGVYDFNDNFSDSSAMAFNHFYYDWSVDNHSQFISDMRVTLESDRWPIITIEPYPTSDLLESVLLDDIVAGHYDEEIERISSNISQINVPVFLRWAHEMENVTGRYPWAVVEYEKYIKAYRYVHDKLSESDNQIYFVWSPVGHSELKNYWPGTEYVDYVGLSVYAYPDWELDNFDSVRSFDEIFSERYNFVHQYEKPVIIAELGVMGDKEFQANWMLQAFRSFKKYDRLTSVIYFDAKDSIGAWGPDYGVPVWNIDPTIFDPI